MLNDAGHALENRHCRWVTTLSRKEALQDGSQHRLPSFSREKLRRSTDGTGHALVQLAKVLDLVHVQAHDEGLEDVLHEILDRPGLQADLQNGR